MQFGGVTFMLAEAILGKTSAKVTHHHVTRDFRNHARSGDRQAETITVDDCRLGKWKRNNRQTIDQNVIGRDGERGNGGAHCFVGGAQNIDSVDLDGIDNTDRPADLGITDQFTINFFA